MNLYFAGPLFTKAELAFNLAVATGLRARGHEVFLPQEQECQQATADAIFAADKEGIDACDCLIACMDGADPDSGTCWEVGYAYGMDKTILLYRTDIRSEEAPLGPYNLMLHQSADVVLDMRDPRLNADDIARRIDTALIWAAAAGK